MADFKLLITVEVLKNLSSFDKSVHPTITEFFNYLRFGDWKSDIFEDDE